MIQNMFIGKITIVPCSREVYTISTPEKRSSTASIGLASIDPNLWRIQKDFSGKAEMMCKDGNVIANNDFYIPIKLMDTYAYHEIIYGPKPWGMPPFHSKPIEPILVPETIHTYINLKKVIMYTKFIIDKLDQATNIAYDIWLTREPRYIGGPKPEDIELMIWIYRASNSEWLPPPAGNKIYEVTISTLIDGKVKNAIWDIWYHPGVSWGGWSYLAYVLTEPSTDVAVDLTEILKQTKRLFREIDPIKHRIIGQTIENMYVNDIEVGTEVFAYNPGYAGIKWILKEFHIVAYRPDIESTYAFEHLKNEIILR
ncbi:MAG: hypothetical protein QXW24_06645 [Ignisphaera sp.]